VPTLIARTDDVIESRRILRRCMSPMLARRAISLLCSNYGAFGVKRTSPHDAISFWPGFARVFPNDVFRKDRHVVRSPRLLAVYSAMDRPEFAERLANDHPDIDDIPFPERGDILLAERIHAGAVSFSLRKSARAINA
jgi:hypothetical protein